MSTRAPTDLMPGCRALFAFLPMYTDIALPHEHKVPWANQFAGVSRTYRSTVTA